MSRKLFALGLAALCLAACSAQDTGKMDVQAFANNVTATISNVQAVAGPAMSSMLDQISQQCNAVAGAWWEIEWASQQSQWDNLVQLANTAVMQILQVLPQISETGGLTYGSPNPRADMKYVAQALCDEVNGLKAYAEETYDVILTVTSMTACADLAPAPVPAPAPAPARRMLKA